MTDPPALNPTQPSRTFKAALLAFGTLLTSLVGLGSAVAFTRLLTKPEYGTYQQTILAYNVVAPLLMAGLPTALFFFLPRNAQRARGVLTENLLGLALIACAFTLFMLSGGNRLVAEQARDASPQLAVALLWFAPYALFMLPAASFSPSLMSMNRYGQVAHYTWSSRLAMLSVAVGAVLVWRTAKAAAIGQVLGAALVFVPALVMMYRACDAGPWRPTWRGLREQFAYGIPVGITRGFSQFRAQLDKVLIAAFYDAPTYAVYATGAIELPLVGVLSTSVTGVLLPETTRLNEQGKRKEALELWQRAAVKSALLVFPLTVYFYVMAPEVMTVLFSAQYAESAAPFRVYTLQLPLRIANVSNMYFTAGKTAPVMWVHLGTLAVNAAIALPLIRWLGPVGAAWGSLLAQLLFMTPVALRWISRHYGTRLPEVLPLAKLLRIGLASLAAGAALLITPMLGGWGDLFRLAIGAILYAVAIAFVFHAGGVLTLTAMIAGARQFLQRGRNSASSGQP